ncbi:MAG: hypothetical protein F7C34_03615 [Desulfurococcales archaeon]|nr:hypothetical protein [Desulfurococcales archaeon]
MGEEGVPEAHGGEPVRIGIVLLKLHRELEPKRFAEECAVARPGLVVAGLPSRYEGLVSMCTAATAYLYTSEDVVSGSRVRNIGLLYLMNLLGKKQLRDVVEELDSIGLVLVVGLGADEAAKTLSGKCGATAVPVGGCNTGWLLQMAEARVRRYSA